MRLRPLQGSTRRGRPPPRLPYGSPKGERTKSDAAATLVEFGAPSTHGPRRVYSTPVCRAGYVPPTGFLTLSTVCSSPGRPALFHAGSARGVPALQGLSLATRSRGSSPRKCPPGVYSRFAGDCLLGNNPTYQAHIATVFRFVAGCLSPPPGRCSSSESVLRASLLQPDPEPIPS